MLKENSLISGNYVVFEAMGVHAGMLCSDGNFYTCGIKPLVFSANQVTKWVYLSDMIDAWKREQERSSAVDEMLKNAGQ